MTVCNEALAEQKMQPHKLITAESLGSANFKREYGLRYAYVAGAMYRGISSSKLVIRVAKAGMLSILGTGGLSLLKIKEEIKFIKQELSRGEVFGVNLLYQALEPWIEEEQVEFYLGENIRVVEASAYLQGLSPSLINYRLSGAKKNNNGTISVLNKIIGKISRPEVAIAFLSPPPEKIVLKLLEQNKITAAEAEVAPLISVADDITVEADSGGHTDRGVAHALLPAIISLRDEMMKKFQYRKKIRVGLAGGIGAPESAAAAFVMGADFIVTGSINHCTVEAGTSDQVKDMLQSMNVQDTDYAPAGDMFEMGSKVQVLKKGLFFPARANKLYALYKQYNSLDELDDKTKQQIQERYFKRTFEDVFREAQAYFMKRNPDVIRLAENDPKHKMALIFRWYFSHTTQLALSGAVDSKVDYQVHTGPALGAFNQIVKGTKLEDWHNRHADQIALYILDGAANVLNRQYDLWALNVESEQSKFIKDV